VSNDLILVFEFVKCYGNIQRNCSTDSMIWSICACVVYMFILAAEVCSFTSDIESWNWWRFTEFWLV